MAGPLEEQSRSLNTGLAFKALELSFVRSLVFIEKILTSRRWFMFEVLRSGSD